MSPRTALSSILCSVALASGLIATSTVGVVAHDFEPDRPPVGPNGGLMAADAAGHAELRIEDGALTVWLTDHADAPISTRDLIGHASILNGDMERVDVDLAPAGDHLLQAEDPRISPEAGSRISFSTVLADGMPLEVRVTVPDEGEILDAHVPHEH